MKKMNFYFIAAWSFILLTTGMFIKSIGETSKPVTYGWEMPATAVLLFGGMFFLGYMARIEDEK